MKKTGKVLSLVLSAALVVSSLSATFASAATTSESATLSLKQDTAYVSNGGGTTGTGLTADIFNLVDPSQNIKSAVLNDNTDVAGLASFVLKDVVVSSGSSVASVKKTTDASTGNVTDATFTLASKDVTGPVTVAARYEGSITRGTNTDATKVYATSTFTVNVLKAHQTYVFTAGGAAAGKEPAALNTLTKDDANTVTGQVYTVDVASDSNALAAWTPVQLSTTATDGKYMVSVNPSQTVTVTTSTTGGADCFVLQAHKLGSATYANVGGVSVLAQKYNGTTPSTQSTERATATTKILNKITVDAHNKIISTYRGATYAYSAPVSATPIPATAQNVTGADIIISAETTVQGGTISGVYDATAGNDALIVNGGSVASVDASVKSVTVNKGAVGNIGDGSSAIAVTVKGGSVGNVATTGAIDIEPADTITPASAGNLSSFSSLIVKSEDQAAAKTGTIKAAQGSAITLDGDKVTIGQIDAAYRDVTLNLTNYTGSVVAPTNAYTQGINSTPRGLVVTSTGTTSATVTGAAMVQTLNLTQGLVNFSDSVKIGTGGVNGAGTFEFPCGKLYSDGSISGVSMRISNNFAVGDKVFTAASYAVDPSAFTQVGFTLNAVAGTPADAFTVKSINFATVNITGASQIVKNTTETYTAVNYPTSTSLPTGDSIKWDFDGNSDYFTFASNGNTATLTAKNFDSTFASLDQGTLTATVVDASGFQDYNYPVANYKVTIIPTALQTYTSDTHTNVSVAMDGTYTYKITSLDGKEHAITNGSSSFKVTKTQSGNVYFYTITPVGKVGESCGMYVDGKLLDVATITAAKAKIDTAKVTKPVGGTYQFKVTAPTKPTFGVGSSALKVIATSSKGNDYFFKVQVVSGKTGDAVGIYVNGTRMSILTIG